MEPYLNDTPIQITQYENIPQKAKQQASVLTVVIKDEEKTLRSKYLIYETYNIDDADPVIRNCIKKTLESFDGEPSDIRVRINLEIM